MWHQLLYCQSSMSKSHKMTANLWLAAASPAPIDVQIVNANSGKWWAAPSTAAIVTGLVALIAVLVTHSFNMRREHRDWQRDKLFDAVRELTICARMIDKQAKVIFSLA
jgi:hypothetical protein